MTYAKEAKRKALELLIDNEHIRRLGAKTVHNEGAVFNKTETEHTVPKNIQCSAGCSISDEDWDSDDNLSDLDALEGNVVLSDCSDDSDNWEPLRKSEGPETVLDDSDTDEDCSVPDGSVPGPPRQDDPDEADCPFEAYHGESPYGRKCIFVL